MHRFDQISRRELQRPSSRKWSLHPTSIGAWVAEMDFGTAPEITAALHSAIDDETLGYLSPNTTEAMARATAEWHKEVYGWDVPWQQIHPVSDVMAAYEVAITRFSPGDSGVIIPTPAYMPLLSFTPTLGRTVYEVPGHCIDGRWTHDLDAIDQAFTKGARTLVVCNPHNPTGSAMTRDELLAIAELVDRHNGRVFADEIHAPLRYGENQHIPYASVSAAAAKHSITATSASKAWNLPGLKAAQLITSNPADEELYQAFGFSILHGASTLGVIAATTAYSEAREWLAEVNEYLDGNRLFLKERLNELIPEIGYHPPEATYVAWLDCSTLPIEGSLAEFFLNEAGVALTDGSLCGKGFDRHVRLVFATPRPVLEDAIVAMARAIDRLR